jgi:N-acetylmuramoyl-L-alanine amidase
MKPYTVTAGHGGTDPGAVHHGHNERDLMTELRDIVAGKLRARGLTVRTDGARGINDPLANALHLIAGSSVAIELHTNASTNPEARGVEVISLPAQKAAAQRIAQGVAKVLNTRTRGDAGWIDQSQSARGRLGFVNRGGLVVEVFFISNQQELAAYQALKWNVATAIVDAVAPLT